MVRLLFSILVAAFAVFSLAHATPIYSSGAGPDFLRRESITTLSTDQISTFRPFSFFASAAYCNPSVTRNWSCGANCDANPGFEPTASGGYVGFDPALNSVVVAHQGTDPDKIIPLLTDADIVKVNLDPDLFPGIDDSIQVHDGFADSHARVAPDVLSAVQTTLSAHPDASVTMVGHSLGAAQALLDSVFLPLHLPSGTKYKYVGYGLPRVGNQAFADYVDSHVTDLTHVTNKQDPIPTVPGRFLEFQHPQGEVHIQDSEEWKACPGQDNDSDECSTGAVPNIFEGEISNHDGPYDVVTMGC
ncbi:lipase [Fomitiporia mediterranea MF3/22]|uniref:lipase n=1 Tax=Fomitiporia mediterranea (strain MF3/22) TaxID=694068 RepID=UPI0004407D72|nr:lipase [Fomitiporia mediterranea MF3/22]EJC99932.1 lipase [Fomitiporia mediterranea MF3/22]